MALSPRCLEAFSAIFIWSHGPFLPRLRIAAHLRCCKSVEGLVIGRMHGDELALEMGGRAR